MEIQEDTLTDLIIVPGHGVCKAGLCTPSMALLDSSWVGIFPGEGPSYVAHAEMGVHLAEENASALLIFSGGQTREDAGPRSEAESYFEIAENAGWWSTRTVRRRAIKEEYARDSFENLLFGLALFRKTTKNWPNMVTVCGWKFKEKRYSLHRQALRWPKKNFGYVGVNNPVGDELPKALDGEKAKVDSVNRDLFLAGPEWLSQRELRDPFHRMHPYRGIHPSLDGLFDYLDRNTFAGKWPW